jgi:hypothetical protein
LLEHGETSRAYCILAESTVVDVSAFDEDVRMARGSAKPPQLRPEAPRVERFMKVENGLPLDDDTAPEGVIATRQPSDFDYRTEGDDTVGHPRTSLAAVDDDTADFRT